MRKEKSTRAVSEVVVDLSGHAAYYNHRHCDFISLRFCPNSFLDRFVICLLLQRIKKTIWYLLVIIFSASYFSDEVDPDPLLSPYEVVQTSTEEYQYTNEDLAYILETGYFLVKALYNFAGESEQTSEITFKAGDLIWVTNVCFTLHPSPHCMSLTL